MSVEFHTEVKGNSIEIPEAMRKYVAVGKRVKVTIVDECSDSAPDYLQELLDNPIPIENYTPMTRDEMHERGNG